jgi:hypothetical protein
VFNGLLNRIPVIRYFTIRDIILRVYFTSKKHAIKKYLSKKKMTVFSILKVDDEYTLKHYPSVE